MTKPLCEEPHILYHTIHYLTQTARLNYKLHKKKWLICYLRVRQEEDEIIFPPVFM